MFAYDQTLASDELAEMRYQASIRPGVQESYSRMFPAPRQDGVRMLAQDERAVRDLPHETLIVHGREDRVIPLESSESLHRKYDLHRASVLSPDDPSIPTEVLDYLKTGSNMIRAR